MLRSSVGSIEAILLQLMATRIGQKQQSDFTVGTGSSQPQGSVTGSSLGKTAAATTAITYADLVDLLHSVKQVYRSMRSTGFMMADATLGTVRKILDGENRPIFQTSTVLGTPDMLLDKPVHANDDMAAPATPILKAARQRVPVDSSLSHFGLDKRVVTYKETQSVIAVIGVKKDVDGLIDGRRRVPQFYQHLIHDGFTTRDGRFVPGSKYLSKAYHAALPQAQASPAAQGRCVSATGG